MPTVLVTEGLRLFFFSNEGTEPPHVHLEADDGYAKFWLEPVELAYSQDLKRPTLRRARELVELHQHEFLRSWHEYFGA